MGLWTLLLRLYSWSRSGPTFLFLPLSLFLFKRVDIKRRIKLNTQKSHFYVFTRLLNAGLYQKSPMGELDH